MRFPVKKNAGCPKAPQDFRQEKMTFSTRRRIALGLPPPPPPESVRARGRTLTSQPNISWIDSLAMVLQSDQHNAGH